MFSKTWNIILFEYYIESHEPWAQISNSCNKLSGSRSSRNDWQILWKKKKDLSDLSREICKINFAGLPAFKSVIYLKLI